MFDLKLDRQRRDLHKSNLPVTSRKIGPVLISSVAGPLVANAKWGEQVSLLCCSRFI
jgi:hypothetical protein